ncbi:MAG: GNAT family N-acetyltransferase [Gammaproteobacteria bacterium]
MSVEILFSQQPLSESEQKTVIAGFEQHSQRHDAPPYELNPLIWRLTTASYELAGVLTAKTLWDWMYIDELWVDEKMRGNGYGQALMQQAETYAVEHHLSGLWLWTQSWQAEQFYLELGYQEFCRFPNFPKGHERIGLRKSLD